MKALPIVAAPSATALGALLLHAAEHTRGHYAPLLAACALLSTLFAAPLQFMNKRAQPFAHTASLAAWSFAVLAALLAVLRPREGPAARGLRLGRRLPAGPGFGPRRWYSST